MKKELWTKQQDNEIKDAPWLTPDTMTWQLNRLFKTNRSVNAVANRQRKVLGFIPKATYIEH